MSQFDNTSECSGEERAAVDVDGAAWRGADRAGRLGVRGGGGGHARDAPPRPQLPGLQGRQDEGGEDGPPRILNFLFSILSYFHIATLQPS